MTITKLIKTYDELKKLKNDYIPLYEWVESNTDYLEKLKQQQLFKEDLTIINETRTKIIVQMNKEKYNLLESKGEK
ncbi:hypothetical protein P344_03510 [Spiroplasma mirum ATCC 29335]|uniref:Uncharacterized protein n=1 Tax=Spiroplasma mirum ATCC 29335 TaxID=838561 RepID=W0GR21_9MOLU|nr:MULTISPECIES: hypothetical protein [Spiroplasma]AHF61016.1 hypothetical protein SMM_0591 [Spiroplasma mirum ATCC 29335]AHI58044.1 hypothetical protein P344_03510 [Spiroplasma mirum ATCC 29335]AKM53123.1 hypothetical protein SATRI_v1c06510 [Spiroplasma atrichopogonis]